MISSPSHPHSSGSVRHPSLSSFNHAQNSQATYLPSPIRKQSSADSSEWTTFVTKHHYPIYDGDHRKPTYDDDEEDQLQDEEDDEEQRVATSTKSQSAPLRVRTYSSGPVTSSVQHAHAIHPDVVRGGQSSPSSPSSPGPSTPSSFSGGPSTITQSNNRNPPPAPSAGYILHSSLAPSPTTIRRPEGAAQTSTGVTSSTVVASTAPVRRRPQQVRRQSTTDIRPSTASSMSSTTTALPPVAPLSTTNALSASAAAALERFRPLIARSFTNSPHLTALAEQIITSPWFLNQEMEPPLETSDPLVIHAKILRPGESRFRAFLEMTPTRTYRCQFVLPPGGDSSVGTPPSSSGSPGENEMEVEEHGHTHGADSLCEGRRCERTEERLDRAQGHARQHLEYRPFVCGGKCARPDCTQRFYSSGQKDDHIRRSIPRRKQCEACGKQISIQNVSRHMKVIHNQSVAAASSTMQDKIPPTYKPY